MRSSSPGNPLQRPRGFTILTPARNGDRGSMDAPIGDDCADDLSVVSSLSGTSQGSSSYDEDYHVDKIRFNRTGILYGRADEVGVLLEALTRISKGPSEAIVVSGEAGTGKSKVVERLRDPISSPDFNGYFITGKYDQFHLNEPYSAIAHAFSDLAELISVTEGDKRRDEVQEVLGPDASLLCKTVPNLSMLFGEVKKYDEADESSENMTNVFPRFIQACRKFLSVLATQQSPICIFLDDIQWADPGSLQVIRNLVTDLKSKYILLVFAYRDNDSNAKQVQELFRCSGDQRMIEMTEIKIGNLNVESICHLICDQLDMVHEEALPLSECIFKRTMGNAFYVLEFLDQLIAHRLVVYTDSMSWRIHLERIQAETNVSSNVVSIIAKRLERLHPHMRAVLTYAAYLGFDFSCKVLEEIVISEHQAKSPLLARYGMTEEELHSQITISQYRERVQKILQVVSVEGLIEMCDTQGTRMRFVHDYPQTVLYNSIPEGHERQSLHLRIGKRLREDMVVNSKDVLFSVVHHLNHASSCVVAKEEQVELATLNLEAAKLAVSKSAFLSASEYLRLGISLLGSGPENIWTRYYDLCLGLHSLAAETAYYNGDFVVSSAMVSSILANGRTIMDKSSAYYAQIDALNAQEKHTQSINEGISILRMLGENVKRRPTKLSIVVQTAKARRLLNGKSDKAILSLPLLENAQVTMITTILNKIALGAFLLGDDNLHAFSILRLLQLSMQNGLSSVSPAIFAIYGVVESKMGRPDNAYRFGMLALKVMHHLCAHKKSSQTMTIAWMCGLYWKRPLNDAPEQLKQAYVSGTAQGDMFYACLAAFSYIITSYHCGANLQELEIECQALCENMQTFNQESCLNLTIQYWWAILSLIGTDPEYHPLLQEDGVTNDMEIKKRAKSTNNTVLLATCRVTKLMTAFHNGLLTTAEDYIKKIEPDKHCFNTHFVFLLYQFYKGLTFYGLAIKLNQRKYRVRAEKVRRYMLKLDQNGCPTATIFLALLNAERSFLLSEHASEVEKAYTHAIRVAANYGFVNYEGLANHLACEAFLQNGVPVRPYFDRAIVCYKEWGAHNKVERLETRYHFAFRLSSHYSNDYV